MLAEIFMLRMEAAARATKEHGQLAVRSDLADASGEGVVTPTGSAAAIFRAAAQS